MELPSAVESPAVARAWVRERLTGEPDISSVAIDTLVLVASELVENATRHGQSAIRASLEVDDGRVVIEVTDDYPKMAVRERDDWVAGTLAFVAACSNRWGVRHQPAGTKSVWVEVLAQA